jgi:hypothetical protein
MIHPLLGTIVVEADAAQLLRDAGVQLWDCLTCHLDGDLGDTVVTGALERAALWSERGVRSSYPMRNTWLAIATDNVRGVTTVSAQPAFAD